MNTNTTSNEHKASAPDRALGEFQRQLLDLTLRNPLLNYRPSTRFGLDIINEEPEQIITWFLDEGNHFKFHATKKSRGKSEGDPSDNSEEEPENDAVANPANSLATPYTPETLIKRLENTQRNAQLFYQERGIGALYLTVGSLIWYEDPEAEKQREAPLILLPAWVERKSARSQWRLQPAQEDPGVNISLAEKMKEYGVALPVDYEVDSWESAAAYLQAVEEAIQDIADHRWAVKPQRMTLGFYSFARFLMWRDLSPDSWPANQSLTDHHVVRGLLGDGFRETPNPIKEGDTDLNAARESIGSFCEVMDIDSSQAETLAQVRAGRNLVVHGPPGTGKSQTITNMITDAVADGKRVLFVAEKMAALQVVASRLTKLGLDGLCLELHSNKASKRALAEEIQATLELSCPNPPAQLSTQAAREPQLRTELNQYCTALRNGTGTPALTLTEAIGLRHKAKETVSARCDVSSLGALNLEEREILRQETTELAHAVEAIGKPALHAFDGCGLLQASPGLIRQVEDLSLQNSTALEKLETALQEIATQLSSREPESMSDSRQLLELAEVVCNRPLGAEKISESAAFWHSEALDASMQEAQEKLQAYHQLRHEHADKVTEQFWQSDLKGARTELVATYDRFFLIRWFSSSYRAAQRHLRALCSFPPPKSVPELIKLADKGLEAQQLAHDLEKLPVELTDGLATCWQGTETDPDRISAIFLWIKKLRSAPAAVPDNNLVLLHSCLQTATAHVSKLKAAVEQALEQCHKVQAAITNTLQLNSAAVFEEPFKKLHDRIQQWRQQSSSLGPWTSYQRLRQPLAQRGLDGYLDLVHTAAIEPAHFHTFLEAQWSEDRIQHAFAQHPHLNTFDQEHHQHTRDNFSTADQHLLYQQRYDIAQQHFDALPSAVSYGTVGYVRKYVNPARRRLPAIRQVMKNAGPVIQRTKPVFLMSPLSIAAYLPPGSLAFDLVIFDEASQVRPADAIGAITRAQQIVVVGDPQQMPPTSFFDKMIAHEDDEDNDDHGAVVDARSILDLSLANGMPDSMLRWHYRSRHQSLIALSNQAFYHNRLHIFPSPASRAGLRFHHIVDGIYDRGKTKTNRIEAEAVAEAAFASFQEKPATSIGLVALSTAQRNALQKAVDDKRREHPDFDEWCNHHHEPLFIKNLENVQGDERDVIMVSIGYGKPAADKPVPLNFGPVNHQGGERRLNVLFTRSRQNCHIFANFTADDLRLENTSSKGIPLLADFLRFAATAQFPTPATTSQTSNDTTCAFKEMLATALDQAGISYDQHIGTTGHRMDFALKGPTEDDDYILGLACDGAGYQAARWARDRDRLQDAVLQGLGWRIHRVWSIDWYQDPERCLQGIIDAYQSALQAPPLVIKRPAIEKVQRKSSSNHGKSADVLPYTLASLTNPKNYTDVDEIPTETLQKWVLSVINTEAPVPIEQICQRIIKTVCDRATERRKEHVRGVIEAVHNGKTILQDGDFLLLADQQFQARNRKQVDGFSFTDIYDRELDAALMQAIADAMGCSDEEAIKHACALLGYTATASNKEILEDRLRRLQS